MTKDKIEEIVRRYVYISRAIKANKTELIFYVGHRKQNITITPQIVCVCEIIKDILDTPIEPWVRTMICGILKGRSDVSLILELPCERSMYYDKKRRLIEQIYCCCIAKQLISYEDILKEGM